MFAFEPKLTIGNLVTAASILVSVAALFYAWTRDRELRQREQADRVRTAAAKTLARFERWQAHSSQLFQDLQPLLVEVSELVVKDDDIILARDFFWKGANRARTALISRRLEENIEGAYVELFAYYPQLRDRLRTTVQGLDAQEERLFGEFISDAEQVIFAFEEKEKLQTATVGNALRNVAMKYRACVEAENRRRVQPLEKFLAGLVGSRDKELVASRGASDSLPPSLEVTYSTLGRETLVLEWLCTGDEGADEDGVQPGR